MGTPPPDAFWEFERAGWTAAAPSYDECWTDTRLFVEPLLDAAGVGERSRILDVACGPGYVSEAAAARGAEPLGLDVSPAMVEAARARRPELPFAVGDAQRLPVGDASFEAVTMNFGILHLSEPETALAEARRVLAPGGRLAFTAWVEEGNAEAEIVDAAVAAHALPVELPEGPAFYRFADPEECRRALAAAGFADGSFRTETVEMTWRVPTAELLFEAELRAGVRTGAILRAQPVERLDAIRAEIVDRVRRYAEDGSFALPVVARISSAGVAA